jgi:DNA-binding NarL/FixJ family response regulator
MQSTSLSPDPRSAGAPLGAARGVPVGVFVVEDSTSMQTALSDLLGELGGFEVLGTASTETTATDWLDRHRGEWDVVTLDLVLSDGSGFNLIRRCRAMAPEGTIVVLSEFVTPVIDKHCVERGATAVFRKSDVPGFVEFCNRLKQNGAH